MHVGAVDTPQQQPFNDRSGGKTDDQRAQNKGRVGQNGWQPHFEDPKGKPGTHVRAKRIDAAMRDVEDTQHAKDDGQTDREQEESSRRSSARRKR